VRALQRAYVRRNARLAHMTRGTAHLAHETIIGLQSGNA